MFIGHYVTGSLNITLKLSRGKTKRINGAKENPRSWLPPQCITKHGRFWVVWGLIARRKQAFGKAQGNIFCALREVCRRKQAHGGAKRRNGHISRADILLSLFCISPLPHAVIALLQIPARALPFHVRFRFPP